MYTFSISFNGSSIFVSRYLQHLFRKLITSYIHVLRVYLNNAFKQLYRFSIFVNYALNIYFKLITSYNYTLDVYLNNVFKQLYRFTIIVTRSHNVWLEKCDSLEINLRLWFISPHQPCLIYISQRSNREYYKPVESSSLKRNHNLAADCGDMGS